MAALGWESRRGRRSWLRHAHSVLSPISPNEDLLWALQCRPLVIVPTPCCSAGRTGLLGDRLGGHTRTGSFSAPCANRTAMDKCFHLAGLPSLTLIRVHTSRYYCVSKMLSPLPGGGQEIIIAWHIFLYQCRPRANMALPCGYNGIVCTCAITTIMIVLAASRKCGIVKFFLSLLASRSRFRVAENGSPRLLEVA